MESQKKFAKFGLVVGLMAVLGASAAHAMPSSKELYRNDKLKVVVYQDRLDKDVFWYVPPIRFFEQDDGTIKIRKEADAETGKINYTFWVVPYMNDQLKEMLAGEIPGVQSTDQLKEVRARQFAIIVPEFDAGVGFQTNNRINNYDYLNNPQPVKLSLTKAQSKTFDAAIKEKPGVMTTVMISFDSEVVKKDITVSASCKDVYRALNIGLTGKYQFLQAEIERAITDEFSKNYVTVSGKGGLPIPDIIKDAIRNCFTPVSRNNNGWSGGSGGGGSPWPSGGDPWNFMFDQSSSAEPVLVPRNEAELDRFIKEFKELGVALPVISRPGMNGVEDPWGPAEPSTGSDKGTAGSDTGSSSGSGSSGKSGSSSNSGGKQSGNDSPWGDPFPGGGGNSGGSNTNDDPWGPGSGNSRPNPGPGGFGNGNRNNNGKVGKDADGLLFQFRKETANTDKNFYYQHLQFDDASEVTGIPIYLTRRPTVKAATDSEVVSLGQKSYIVNVSNTASAPLKTGIIVGKGEQYVIDAAFSCAISSWTGALVLDWDKTWGSTDGDLYYRIGTGPWNAVNKRALIKTNTTDKGELQLYLDRAGVWNRIPENKRKWYSALQYQTTLPQFNVTVAGRKVVLK